MSRSLKKGPFIECESWKREVLGYGMRSSKKVGCQDLGS